MPAKGLKVQVYKEESLQNRLDLPKPLGFWLDQWLFFFAEDTHPIWCVRPLGLRSTAELALNSTAEKELFFRKNCLANEVQWLIKLAKALESIPDPPDSKPVHSRSPFFWTDEWLEWFRAIAVLDRYEVIDVLIVALSSALCDENLINTGFYTRRLAAEVGETIASKRTVFIRAIREICDSGAFGGTELSKARVEEALLRMCHQGEERDFVSVVGLAPVPLSVQVIDDVEYKWEHVSLETEEIERVVGPGEPPQRLVGLRYSGQAASPALARRETLDVVRNILEYLRLRHYVRTHLYGALKLEEFADRNELWISLGQPFWTRKPGNWRKVPKIPPKGTIDQVGDGVRTRVEGACWHMSQALADWQEDIHSAASKIWQGLEAVAPDNGRNDFERVWEGVAGAYLDTLPWELAYWQAKQVRAQAGALFRLYRTDGGKRPDWYFWNEETELLKWYGRVLDKRSANYYGDWVTPEAWPFFFDEDVGTLPRINRRLRLSGVETWIDERLERDLGLLYGLRNALAHAGERKFSSQMAGYLGHVGLELLIDVMQSLCGVQRPYPE